MNILILDTKSGAVEWEVPHGGGVSCSVFTPDAAALAVKTAATDEANRAIELWQPPSLVAIDAAERRTTKPPD